MTSRRVFIAFAIALLMARTADAQPMARVGLLGDISWDPLRQGLRDLGYVEGKNVVFEVRRSDGRNERWSDLATELVQLKVHVIVTGATSATLAAKRATTTIPIVMAASGEALATGLVASLARPGGNVTGLTQLGAGLAPKRLELLKEAVPNISRVAFLWNPANPANKSQLDEAQVGAAALALTVQPVEVHRGEQFERAFSTMMQERPGALLMTADGVHQLHIDWIVTFAAKNRLPVMYQLRENVERGGLMAYGPLRADLIRRATVHVDKILKGAKPADLPVEQPTKFELVINLRTAKALGLAITGSLLLRADQVIE